MIPRARLDIGWTDLGYAALQCIIPGDRHKLTRTIEERFSTDGDAFACLSVRTGFELLLQALALPAGSEVLISAITIPDMSKIVRAHDLVPVPVDLDPETLELDRASLERACSPRSRVLLVAHLFGAQADFSDAIQFARQRNILFIEDCAQSYAPNRFAGDPRSDVRLFSFGPIKTATALGGAILTVRDAGQLQRMRTLAERYPVQTRVAFALRVAKYSLLRLLGTRPMLSLFVWLCKLAGKSHDAIIGQLTRGFHGSDLIARLRRQPSWPQVALLNRRLATPDIRRLRARTLAARRVIRRLDSAVARPGTRIRRHTHWIFPILLPAPLELMRTLGEAGFDATRGTTSMAVVEPVPERPDVVPVQARRLMAEILYVPVYPEMRGSELDRLTAAIAKSVCFLPQHDDQMVGLAERVSHQ